MLTRRTFATLASTALLLVGTAACSSDSDGAADPPSTTAAGGTTSTTAGSTDPATDPAYAERGSYGIGSLTLALDDGRRVMVWYPAAEGDGGPTDSFDIASLLSPQLQEQIDPELRPVYELEARTGAEPAEDGPFPVVLFSHGYAGFPEQSADLTAHFASWGFVVIAPDHVERSLSGLLGTAAQGVPKQEDPAVLSAALDAAIADGERDGSPLAGLLDTEHVAVTGHSAGASASYRTASTDDRIDAVIAYSVGLGGGPDGANAEPPPVPEVPVMVMLGDADGVITPERTREVYEGLSAPRYLVEIADAGHLVFSDICLIGREQGGLVGLVKEAGLDLPDQLLRLASDGCEEKNPDPADAFGAINHLSVAFLRHTFGIDAEPVGLDPKVTESFTTADVTLTADPA